MHNGCVVRGGVGTGKSITALSYYLFREIDARIPINGAGSIREPTKPRDIYVITTSKKRDDRDWEIEAAPFRISRERNISLGGVQLVVDSWNNIGDYVGVEGAFFIFDEQRLVGAGAWVKAFYKIAAANHWILLSATPGDNWMDYAPVFIANGFVKNITEFKRTYVKYKPYSQFPKVEGYLHTRTLEKFRDQVLVEMPYLRHTKRHQVQTTVDYDHALYDRVHKDRWHVYDERPLNDVGEMYQVMRKVANSDPSRLGAVMSVYEKAPRLIVFYTFDYELEALRTLAGTLSVPVSEYNGHKHQPIPDGDKWIYLVQYTAGSEGWNCVTTDSILFYSLPYSYKIWEQAHGRIDRLNTKYVDLYYYILKGSSFIDESIWRALRNKKNFNLRKAGKAWTTQESTPSSGPTRT